MRNMSFAMTTNQILCQSKTVTRRFGWWFLKPGDLVQPVEKGMGLKKGEQVRKLGGPIKILRTDMVPLDSTHQLDCYREGFPDMVPEEFVQMLVDHYRCDPSENCNRIEFCYTEELEGQE